FLKSPGGAQLAGSVMSGYAQGKQAEEMAKEEERRARYYDEQWRDPGKVGQLMDAARSDIETPMGFMNRARRVTQYLDQRASQFPMAPGNPQDVAQMAVGG